MNELLDVKKLTLESENFIDYIDVDDLTLKTYKVGIESFLRYLKNKKINYPTRNDVIAYRNMLRGNYSSNTVNTYMIAVRKLFKYLEINKKYEDITKDVKGSKYSTTPKKEILSSEQIQSIYKNIKNPRDRCLFSLMCSTGLRVCEISTALIEDIKIYNGELVLFILGKKRDSKCEYVKLSAKVYNDILEYIGDRKTGHIFISDSNNNKGNGLTTTSLRSIIKRILRENGIDKDTISCHSLRRSFAVISYELGNSIYDIEQVLHHKSISTTERYLKQVSRDKNKIEFDTSTYLFGGS